jgi:RNA polymerase sigma-70 factor (ECF subfamily)
VSGVTSARKTHLSEEAANNQAADYARLVRKAAGGNRAAMEELLLRAQEVAFRFSFLVCGHAQDAEDVMQEALLKTYRHVARIRRPEAFRTWLYRTVRNACLMKRRRRADEPAHMVSIEEGVPAGEGGFESVELEDPRQAPEQAAINSWLGRQLRAALDALPPSYRVIVFLREMEGLSTREVARVTGISEANVKTRLHRARGMLREQLERI